MPASAARVESSSNRDILSEALSDGKISTNPNAAVVALTVKKRASAKNDPLCEVFARLII